MPYRSIASFRSAVLWAALAGSAAMLPAADEKPTNSAAVAVPKKDDFWQGRHKAFLERAKKGDVDVVFLGDSLTQGWELEGKEVWKSKYEPLKAANFGISGDRIQNVLWRITEGKELDGLKPKLIVLLIGTNNLGADRHGQLTQGGNSAEEIAEGIGAVVGELRRQLPMTKILLVGLLPRAADPEALVRARIKDVNKRLAKLDDGKQVRCLDAGAPFLDKESRLADELMPDALHLSAKGYKTLADALQPALDELLKK